MKFIKVTQHNNDTEKFLYDYNYGKHETDGCGSGSVGDRDGGSVYHFSVKVNISVTETNLSVTPQSFSVSVAKGAKYVKSITIKNTGGNAEIYFEKVVEGPDPDAISVSFHDIYGDSITSSNKLSIPATSEVDVNVHIKLDDDAATGKYTIYILAKEI